MFIPHEDLVRLEKTTNRRREVEIWTNVFYNFSKAFWILYLKIYIRFYFCLLIIHLHKLKIHIRPQNFVNHLGAIFINHLVIWNCQTWILASFRMGWHREEKQIRNLWQIWRWQILAKFTLVKFVVLSAYSGAGVKNMNIFCLILMKY